MTNWKFFGWMALTFAAIVAAMLWALPMPANSAECRTINDLKRDAAVDPGVKISEMGSTEAKAFLAAYNAYPPASNYIGDYLAVMDVGEHYNNLYVIVFGNGCFIKTLRISRENFSLFMESI